MSKPWTEHLKPSEVSFVNDIIEQIPTAMGARDAFITCLQNLADSPGTIPYKFLIASTMDGRIYGTNEESQAEAYAASEDNFVAYTTSGEWIMADLDREKITEARKIEVRDEDLGSGE